MKVILLENLRKIGTIGEIIDVKRGFARNFLISSKKALYASKENISKVIIFQNIMAELNLFYFHLLYIMKKEVFNFQNLENLFMVKIMDHHPYINGIRIIIQN